MDSNSFHGNDGILNRTFITRWPIGWPRLIKQEIAHAPSKCDFHEGLNQLILEYDLKNQSRL
jgi:hypothetical protein